jgi:hypothetical protein
MADPDTEEQTALSWTLIEWAREKRDGLLRLIEESQKTIDRSRERIAR